MDNNMADKIDKFIIKLYPSLFFVLFFGKMWDEYEFVGYIRVEYCPCTFVLIPWQPQHGVYVRICLLPAAWLCVGAVTAWAKEPAARSLADTFLFFLPLKF